MEPISKGINVIIEENVSFGKNVVIGHNVIIYAGTKIGDNVVIQDNVVIGKQPSRAKNSILSDAGQLPPAVIGSGCTIGTSSIIYANATLGEIGRAHV